MQHAHKALPVPSSTSDSCVKESLGPRTRLKYSRTIFAEGKVRPLPLSLPCVRFSILGHFPQVERSFKHMCEKIVKWAGLLDDDCSASSRGSSIDITYDSDAEYDTLKSVL